MEQEATGTKIKLEPYNDLNYMVSEQRENEINVVQSNNIFSMQFRCSSNSRLPVEARHYVNTSSAQCHWPRHFMRVKLLLLVQWIVRCPCLLSEMLGAYFC